MKLISHRGNIRGKNTERENQPRYIDEAIEAGYEVEIDIWEIDGKLYLGHDSPLYDVDFDWLSEIRKKIWIHCKNHNALLYFNELESDGLWDFNYFWHQTDDIILTSMNFMWVYPGKQPLRGSISVMPEYNDDDVSICMGICSDVIEKYKNDK